MKNSTITREIWAGMFHKKYNHLVEILDVLEMKKAIKPPRDKDLLDIRLLEGIINTGRG